MCGTLWFTSKLAHDVTTIERQTLGSLYHTHTHTIWSHHCSNSQRHKQQCWYRNCSYSIVVHNCFTRLITTHFIRISKTKVVRVHNLIWAIKRVFFSFVSLECLFCFDFKHLNSKIIEESRGKNVTDSGLFIVHIIISPKEKGIPIFSLRWALEQKQCKMNSIRLYSTIWQMVTLFSAAYFELN